MFQELLTQLEITPKQASWDATITTNQEALQEYIKTFDLSISVQGSRSSPSTLLISLQDAAGNAVGEQFYIRVRICALNGYSNAPNASISTNSGTTVVETHTTNKDITVQSAGNGTASISLTDATAETVTLRIGPSALCPHFANHHNSLNVTHS